MLEVIIAVVLMLFALLVLLSIPFMGSRTLVEETEELRKARDEFCEAIIREFRLREICQWLTDFASGFQRAMENAFNTERQFGELHEALKAAGVKLKKPTFNDYLRDAHGIGSQEKKRKGETT